MSKAGAPKGNQNGRKGRVATAALNKALKIASGEPARETTETYQALIDIWTKQIEKAQDGDSSAAQMIIDRLEGKPGQYIDQTLNAGKGVTFNLDFGINGSKQDDS